MLSNRRIVLGVSGGVAAYKAAYLTRRLLERGAVVRVVMTPGAAGFVGAQTFAALTGEPVIESLFGDPSSVSPHTELGQWAELIVVAPATLHTLSKIAHGISGDALSATILASRAPLLLVPAMHTEMWEHPATRTVVKQLESVGHTLVGPVSGELAGGDVGLGRMAEPDEIVEQVCRGLAHADGSPWFGKKVVITAGGTREAIDPVRYIGNRSTGKMGYAIATAAFWRGANVELISSSSLSDPIGVNVTHVASAQEMANATWSAAKDADVAILAAAVADFRPTQSAPTKLRRVDGLPPIELQETSDILAGIVDMDPRPILVGFAAQTGSLDDAFRKVSTYGVDLLVANDVSSPGSGFGTDTNQVTVLYPDGSSEPWPLMTKSEVAGQLLDHIVDLI